VRQKIGTVVVMMGAVIFGGAGGGDGAGQETTKTTIIGKAMQRFEPNGQGVTGVAMSPDGKRAACSNTDGTEWVWDVQTGAEVWHKSTGNFMALSTEYSGDGKKLLVSDGGGVARIMDAEKGDVLVTMKQPDEAAMKQARFFDSDKKVVAGGFDGKLRQFDAATGTELDVFEGDCPEVETMAVSDGAGWVAVGGDEKVARVWDLSTGKKLSEFTFGGKVTSIACSPDGKKMYVGVETAVIRVMNPANCKTIKVLKNPRGLESLGMDVSPDGKYLVMANYGMKVRVVDAETGEILVRMDGHKDVIWSTAFSKDGKYVVSGGGGKTDPRHDFRLVAPKDDLVRVWDLSGWLAER
jgi:WD40 repeat protein